MYHSKHIFINYFNTIRYIIIIINIMTAFFTDNYIPIHGVLCIVGHFLISMKIIVIYVIV